mgnify:CR=1 FL=1
MAGLGTIIEGKNAVLSVLESGRAIKISYLHQETKSENFETILNLAKRNKVEISAIKSKEACPLDLAPTSSTTSALAFGDALAIALLESKGFTKKDFASLSFSYFSTKLVVKS